MALARHRVHSKRRKPLIRQVRLARNQGGKVLRRPSRSSKAKASSSSSAAVAQQSSSVAVASEPGRVGCLRRSVHCREGKRQSRSSRQGGQGAGGTCRRVRFEESVQVVEFSRLIGGGGGVPSDAGSALGLGACMGTATEALSSERPGTGKLDQDVPTVPPKARAQLLREAMGKAAYAKAQRESRKELQLLQSLREASNETEEDFEPMPVSLAQARRVAEKLRREVLADSGLAPPARRAGPLRRPAAVAATSGNSTGSATPMKRQCASSPRKKAGTPTKRRKK
eukprot:TRINITY_DN29356_c0_g1_i1.p1 TRINITY_DN29356_c0_g1~~TRINITY_DN29356_c0_g1_i1.p1  ORF type:complete len:283 (-),score=54.51 TRINITY_DN29356_c0_g1_i1:87-935(-)